MSKNNTKIVIWAMEPRFRLNYIIELLQLNYKQEIDYLVDHANLSAYDKTLQNKWLPAPGRADFVIERMNIVGQEIEYIPALGQYELQLGASKGLINNTPLPRDIRVFNRSVNAVFFEYFGRVYCALEVSASQEGKVRSALFGQGYRNPKEEWGKVYYKDIDTYALDSRFFYWIFSKRGQSIPWNGSEDESIQVVDVSAVSQLAERQAYDSTSQGANVLGSVQALSGLGSNQSVYNGGFYFLKHNDFSLFMEIGADGSCTIDTGRSNFIKNGQIENVSQNFQYLILVLYTSLFPGLKELYNTERTGGVWTILREADQRKQWALEVVKELCEENEIALSELESILT
ncbi:hypothetical protein N7988_28120 (plasmid) [Bacillus cereus]|uniref:hypothetical protein n=1 Tax=Bacillus cereus TaxID=1396 RepID=UPI0021CB175F|nr:hypothetical protein [Bacillus cereus]MCU7756897.1 hypothetical protein [Bacillus cereus]MDC7752537.1 hypothetical protein [Bacillus cereus]MEB8704753.1 hypothetical protein [Bacillus cereus]UXP17379.1 hypothetical protein N7988_28120 [Bacillus cereus]